MKDEMRKGKVEVASHDRDLRASRFPRAKEDHQGERSEYIVLPFDEIIRVLPLTCESRHSPKMALPSESLRASDRFMALLRWNRPLTLRVSAYNIHHESLDY
jgi:hypothetical protein